ncbi:hypothetical protein CPB83DRAFT_848316 [Crepidotus variabilis]|uniref:Uncharacterized protein n=1 Tax=Crepidotus variabilis TaxID=179855 RepID=A0A9P6EN05_9AGAR|nr:hypothetical protein CPB83DRAFT_848316 [Crepidotus variabilis]
MTQETAVDTFGFPVGYFVIKSVATGKVFDVGGDSIEDGTEILLFPEKEKSLVESFRDPSTNNQVFFIDTSGALCSRSSGHALDIEGERVVLRHRRPISQPFPNSYAHPLPKFSYRQKTGEITVHFGYDPTYPPPTASPSANWTTRTYLLTAVPQRRPRTMLDNASEFFASNFLTPISLFAGGPPASPARPDHVFDGEIDLRDDDIVEEERGEEGEVDDDPSPCRELRIVTASTSEKEMMDLLLSERARQRRRWVILPLRVSTARSRVAS